jgi:hypothetical protein
MVALRIVGVNDLGIVVQGSNTDTIGDIRKSDIKMYIPWHVIITAVHHPNMPSGAKGVIGFLQPPHKPK